MMTSVVSPHRNSALPFGAHRRLLPWNAEAAAVAFLALHDISSLYLCSHSLSKCTEAHLATSRQLFVNGNSFDTDRFDSNKFNLGLALKHCVNLTALHADAHWSKSGNTRKRYTWISKMLDQNRHAFRLVRADGLWCSSSVGKLTFCPNLQAIPDLDGKMNHALPATFSHRLTPEHLPHLQELRLSVRDGKALKNGRLANHAQLHEIISRLGGVMLLLLTYMC